MAFYDRTNSAAGGAFYSRTNDADLGSAQAFGALAGATAGGIDATVAGYATVVLAEPLNLDRGSILHPDNFTGTPLAGATVRYPTTNGFAVLSDGTCWADTNTGSYACYYDEGLGAGEIAFTVTLDNHVDAIAALAVATAEAPAGGAIGGFAGVATGAVGAASVFAPTGDAYQAIVATGDIGAASSVTPAGDASAPAFPGDASGAIGLVTANTPTASAAGAGAAAGAIGTAIVEPVDGAGNEAGRGNAVADIGTALAISIDGKGRAQWGRVEKHITIWSRVN